MSAVAVTDSFTAMLAGAEGINPLLLTGVAVVLFALSGFLLLLAIRKRPTQKVRIFIDYANFDNAWRNEGPPNINRLATHNRIDWEKLPGILLAELERKGGIWASKYSYRGTHVYASGLPEGWEVMGNCPNAIKTRFASQKESDNRRRQRFEQVSLIDGYDVQFFDRQVIFHKDESGRCEGFEANEKQVDTSLTTDLLQSAFTGGFDIAILISGDSDYLPAVKVVQNELNKKVIHAGFENRDRRVRPEYWGHLLFDGALAKQIELNTGFDADAVAANTGGGGGQVAGEHGNKSNGGRRRGHRRRRDMRRI